MSASQSVLLIYKPSCDVQVKNKYSFFPCACCVVFLFLRLGLRRRDKQEGEGKGRQLQTPTESGFGYGGAGDSPIGLKLFEWASLEQSPAPPPA